MLVACRDRLPESEWGPHRAKSVPPDFAAGRYGPPAAAKKRNQSNIKLAALPFQHPRDVYDTARWVGKDWAHPRGEMRICMWFTVYLRVVRLSNL